MTDFIIKDKLTAMQAANQACSKVDIPSNLEGAFDPVTGDRIEGVPLGSVERLVRDVIDEIFDEEGVEAGASSAMNRIHGWLERMAREIADVNDALARFKVAPDFGEEEEVA